MNKMDWSEKLSIFYNEQKNKLKLIITSILLNKRFYCTIVQW